MPEPRRTNKPCPGCGEGPGYNARPAFREVDKVCGSCARDLAEAAARREALAARATAAEVCCRVPDAGHMWTHFPKEPRRPFGSQEGLQYSFRELALALTEPAPWPGDAHKIHRFGNGHGSCRQFTEPAHLELLVKLDEQVRAALKGAFSDGKATGSNLLVRLASGDLSTTDFIEKKEQV